MGSKRVFDREKSQKDAIDKTLQVLESEDFSMSVAPNQDKRQDTRRLLLERLFAALSNPSKKVSNPRQARTTTEKISEPKQEIAW
jgi:hypothetical protein